MDSDRRDAGIALEPKANGHAGRLFLYNATVQYENLGDLKINKHLFESLRGYGNLRFNTSKSKWPVPSLGVRKPGVDRSSDNHDTYFAKMGIEPHETLSAGLWDFGKIIFENSRLNVFKPSHDKSKVYLVFTPGGISGNLTPGVLARAVFLILASQLGARSVRLGVSIGPFSPKRATIERLQARCLTVNTVRDSLSRDYARQIGIPDVRHFPDFGFLVQRNTETPNPLPAKDPYCVISLRSDNLSPEQVQQMLDWPWSNYDVGNSENLPANAV